MPIYKMDGKKAGRQQYRVRINYTDSSGKAHQIDRVAYGSAEAKLLEAQLKAEYKNGVAVEKSITIQSLSDEYKLSKSSEVRATSLDKSRQKLDTYILPYLKDVKLKRLNAKALQDWKNTIAEMDIAISTKQNIFGEFRALLNYAVKMEYIPKNPIIAIGNFREAYFEKPQEKMQYYTPEQFVQYIRQAREVAEATDALMDWGYYVFFMIAYYTGMRKGEINALRWSDIDDDVIHVRRSIAQKLRGDDVETPPKNKSSYRDLQMPKPLLAALTAHRERQEQTDGFTDQYRVCGGIRCLRDTSIDKRNRAFAEAAGLPRIRIHDFRHSHASLLANNGINIQEIARRLGHSKIEMTWNTYAHLYPREEERAVEILNTIENV